jgi:hypothetical protein
MTQRMQCQVEMVGETATLYVSGTLGRDNTGTLVLLCTAMPARIRTLRLDLHALGQLSADAVAAVRGLLAHWRENRQGDFKLNTSHLMATLREAGVAAPSYEASVRPGLNDALVATYL